MSIIPKISLSTVKKNERHILTSKSHTTANFGFVQPTFCRELMPKGKFEVGVTTRVLNAPMPVPTYGDIRLIHKHVFVPYVDICPQYESFLAGQSYTPGSGTSYVPNELPKFKSVLIAQYILGRYADWTYYLRNDLNNLPVVEEDDPKPSYEYEPLLLDGSTKDATKMQRVKDVYNNIFHNSGAAYHYGVSLAAGNLTNYARRVMPSAKLFNSSIPRATNDDRLFGNWLLGGWSYIGDNEVSTTDSTFDYQDYTSNPNGLFIGNPDNSYVTLEDADFISVFGGVAGSGDVIIAFKLRPAAKRFRSILLGLGYQFVPNLWDKVDDANWLKIFSFYKSWFNLFRPKREFAFTDTNCYKLIKVCEGSNANTVMYPSDASSRRMSDLLCNFLDDLAVNTSYYVPQDYFGMSVAKPNENFMQSGTQTIPTYTNKDLNNLGQSDENSSVDQIDFGLSGSNNVIQVRNSASNTSVTSVANPANMVIAMQILRYINKNTIIGRKISDFLRAHYGISVDSSHDLESVYLIGEVNVDINIEIINSTAGTDSDELGSYAGWGIGYRKKDNKFVFENKNKTHGCWITLTTIVPNNGYYQGFLRENLSLKRYDFPCSEFDALGYELLTRDEVMADYPTQVAEFNQPALSDFNLKKGFGFVPRYSSHKVGRDIVSGDLSLRGYRNQYSGYYLNRKFPYESRLPYWIYQSNLNKVTQYSRLAAPLYIPKVVNDNFRRISLGDSQTNYNRVFYSESTLDDHFIVNSTFDVVAYLPMVSLRKSFDTFNTDGNVIDITHS